MLDVYLNDKHIGCLEKTRKGARFQFDDDVIDGMQGLPLLSTALPVKQRSYSEGLTGAWFENLLPEGDRLERLCRTLNCAPSDYMAILEEIGWECAGAISLLPKDAELPKHSSLTLLSDVELADILNNLPAYETEEELVARTSLGGFQEKLLVVANNITVVNGYVRNADIALPACSEITTHILKPQISARYPRLIEAEAWAMEAARSAARCARSALLRVDGAPMTLIVKRFDRVFDGDRCKRLHQEDCCQAMGLPPSGKYTSTREVKGDDPSFQKIARLLLAYSLNYEQEITELLRQMTVNLVLGNTDAHAKNYTFLYEKPCEPTLSPMYDVTPSFDIEPNAEFLSMRIAGKVRQTEIGREDIIDEAISWGMSGHLATQILDETLRNLNQGITEARSIYPDAAALFEKPTIRRLKNLEIVN